MFATVQAMQPADYELAIYEGYPAVYDARLFAGAARAWAAVTTPDGRRLLARVLRAGAAACDIAVDLAFGAPDLDYVVPENAIGHSPPQLALIMTTAAYCRLLAANLQRYAGLATGTQTVTLSKAARVALNAFESVDVDFVLGYPFETQTQATILLNGVSVQ